LKTEKTVPTSIEAIQGMLSDKKMLTEDQFLVYVMHSLKKEQGADPITPDASKKEKLFTVVWFDCEKNSSELHHTYAESSIEAIENAQSVAPSCTNMSAYQLKIPMCIRFTPEDANH
jgi:hypothetical protein